MKLSAFRSSFRHPATRSPTLPHRWHSLIHVATQKVQGRRPLKGRSARTDHCVVHDQILSWLYANDNGEKYDQIW